MTPQFAVRIKAHPSAYITKTLHKSLTAPSSNHRSFRPALLHTDLVSLTEDPVFWAILHLYRHSQTASAPWRVVLSSAHSPQHNGLSLDTPLQITSEKSQNEYHIWVIQEGKPWNFICK